MKAIRGMHNASAKSSRKAGRFHANTNLQSGRCNHRINDS